MKRYFRKTIIFLLAAVVFVCCITVVCAESDIYVVANGECTLKLKVTDGEVPVYNNGFILGVNAGSKTTDSLFCDEHGGSVSYENTFGDRIGTGSVIKTDGKSYTAVVYGDLDGDSVLDVVDVTLIERICNNKFDSATEAQKEAALLVNEETITISDYSEAVNKSLAGESSDKNRKIPLSLCDISFDTSSAVYNGSAQNREVKITGLNANTDYTVDYKNTTNAGIATVTIDGVGKYIGTVVKQFNINKAHVDSALSFTSKIYAYNSTLNTTVTMADAFKPFVSIKYNGSTTAPTKTQPGIYLVTADVTNADGNYDHNAGTFTLGTIVIAPQTQSGSYNVSVNNADRQIIINIVKPNASNSVLKAEFEKWKNSSYTLNVDGTDVSDTVASSLPDRSFTVYTNQSGSTSAPLTETPTSDILGCYLPEDDTLWTDSSASNTSSVSLKGVDGSAFTVVFRQNSATIEAAKASQLLNLSESCRNCRTNDPKAQNLACYVKRNNNQNCMHLAINSSKKSIADSVSGNGMKYMMVGYVDSIYAQTSSSSTFAPVTSSNKIKLYDEENVSFNTYSVTQATGLIGTINGLLADFNVGTLSISTKLSTFEGKFGYLNYLCVKNNNGLRYSMPYYVDFKSYSASTDCHYKINSETCTNGTVSTDVSTTERTIEVKTSALSSIFGGTNYTFVSTDCMSPGEPFKVTTTPSSGYNLESISVKNTSTGALLQPDEWGLYYVPSGNISVFATFVAK